MIERKIILGDGTVLENSQCGYAGERDLWCTVSGKTMTECAVLFSEPENVQTIIGILVLKKYIFKGFTEMMEMRKENNAITIRLTWQEGQPHSVEEIDLDPDRYKYPDD